MRQSEQIKKLNGSDDCDPLATAMAVFLEVWNMECPECATWLRQGIQEIDGVLNVEVFYPQSVAVIIYDPEQVATDRLLQVVREIGKGVCHFYGAEIIGQCSAQQAMRS